MKTRRQHQSIKNKTVKNSTPYYFTIIIIIISNNFMYIKIYNNSNVTKFTDPKFPASNISLT